ncbi:glycoside hydrolase family 19 protein [Sphingobium yanoikuyae]|uniref:glycoside hydrolase family 19 protein n=1 Tax=Sphingobium yanoikuyae TaxID=13690 RepID=UPI003EFCF1CB
MDWKPIQTRLGVVTDGIAGPKTYAALFRAMGARDNADALGKQAARDFVLYGLTTPLRIAHFMAQAAHETGGFKWLREIWGPTLAQLRYEGRNDLGNVQPGDGKRFLGRGIFQLTGRANYERAGKAIGQPLASQPELAERPDISVTTACDYWQARGLSALADRDDVLAVTKKVNGGTNGLADRKVQLVKAKGLLL